MKEIASLLAQNHILAASVILFGIGFVNLLLQKNLIRKIIGLNIMDTAIFLLLTSFGYIEGRYAPILVSTTDPAQVEQYVNPIPTGLVLTGIVVSVSCTAFMLALTQRLYLRYHTLDIDAILMMVRKGGN
ncbi:MAG: cation:proton antiporter subunit C [Bacteroidales bacterium]|nr:cation:proton antiporter subunit C [Fournierella massiliensis]MCF2557424.1 cation:proton antiporter subunit C [Fournierella massiliensis]MCI6740680.1 cation:proton antiporter subunit C [Bacteroidales bacterium]